MSGNLCGSMVKSSANLSSVTHLQNHVQCEKIKWRRAILHAPMTDSTEWVQLSASCVFRGLCILSQEQSS